jgi:hypothetical protein
MRPWLTTWGEVIASLPDLAADDLVCFGTGPCSPTDPCLVADSETLNEEEDVPAEAAQRGWTACLDRDTIRSVLSNVSLQVERPDLHLILRAVAYYTDHDAYIAMPDPKPRNGSA